jgi:hypothetical protein
MTRVLIPLGLFCLALVGCGSGARLLDTPPPPATGASISGKLLSGSIPVSGAHVYLMAVAETGFGKPSISLLNAGSTGSQDSTGTYVLTASDGTFTLPGQYSCSATTNVYVFTSGGDSGLGQNSAATHLATVGACPQQGAVVTPLTINEVTTVAMAFATASFATDPLHVSSSGSPLARTGEANAFTNASHLASVNTGIAPAMLPSGAATVPQTTINTLANILFSCNHSAGPGSAACQSLLGSAGSAGPYSDTAAAMLGIAHSPANSVATLFAQQSTAPPFAPYLTVAPNDFSLGLVFTGGGMNATQGMAVDSMGNVWSTNDSYNLTEISSAGVFLSGPNGYVTGAYFPGQIAVDLNDNVWIGSGAHTFDGPGSLVEVSSSGMTLSGVDGYGHGLIHTPLSLAIDGNNNIWIADMAGNSVAEFSNSGQILSGTIGFTGGGVSNPYTIAIDASSNAWVTNYSSHGLTELTSTGSPLSPATGFTGAGFPGGGGIALDHSGEVWIASAGTFSPQVSKLSATGAILSGAGYVGGGIKAGEGSTSIAIDGDGNAWLPLYVGPGVVELSNAGIPLSGNNGLQGGVAQFPNSIVLDGSGDVWVANDTLAISPVRGVPSVYTWRITELIGAAAPVVTPLAAAVKGNALGSRP